MGQIWDWIWIWIWILNLDLDGDLGTWGLRTLGLGKTGKIEIRQQSSGQERIFTRKEEEACAGPGKSGDQPLHCVALRCVAWAPQSYFVVPLELLVLVLDVVMGTEVW